MNKPFAFAGILGAFALSGCVETTMIEPVVTTGGNLTGVTATNCKAAIARTANRSTNDIVIFDVVESEAGNVAQATLAGADKPWICRTDRNGLVGQVMYSGEG